MSQLMKQVLVVRKLNAAHHPSITKLAKFIEDYATTRGCRVVDDANKVQQVGTLFVFSLGGDGTVLQSLRTAANAKETNALQLVVCGINTGNVGFLTGFDTGSEDHIKYVVDSVLTGDTKKQFVLPLFATQQHGVESNTHVAAFNDVVISGRRTWASNNVENTMITYELIIGGQSAGIHRADALILSTPIGSTAYSLSAGGSIVMPEQSGNIVQIVPVAPTTISSRPIITSKDISVRVWGSVIATAIDGVTMSVTNRECIQEEPTILNVQTNSHKSVQLVYNKNWNFFSAAQTKLGWALGSK